MRCITAVARCALAALMVVMMLAQQAEAGVSIYVGGSTGWTNKANINYTMLLSNYQVKIGDTTVFYNSDNTDHNAVLVDKTGYDTCGASGLKAMPFTISPGIAYTLTWIQSGDRYVICDIPGHCLQGMKVYIQVLNVDGSVNTTSPRVPTPTPTPPMGGTPTPPVGGTPTAPVGETPTPPVGETLAPPAPRSFFSAAPPMPGLSWTFYLVTVLVSTFSLMAAAVSL